jgi:3-isopropylmalate/(R)-2-methylmalate dehydratase small subunit
MSRTSTIRGRVWVIAGNDGVLIHDIDTDQIYHNSHLAVTDINQMGQYSFGNLKGWEDFPRKAGKGDIIIVGRNFGCGSSRQQAVDCFRSLGVSAVIAMSFGAIYKRNAVNSGFGILEAPSMGEKPSIQTGDEVELDLATGKLSDLSRSIQIQGNPGSKVQLDIYQAGSLFEYGRQTIR